MQKYSIAFCKSNEMQKSVCSVTSEIVPGNNQKIIDFQRSRTATNVFGMQDNPSHQIWSKSEIWGCQGWLICRGMPHLGPTP